jgi:hypothetical protein
MSNPAVVDLARVERQRRIWRILGITVAVIVVLGGLVMIGLVIFYVIAINAWASNK